MTARPESLESLVLWNNLIDSESKDEEFDTDSDLWPIFDHFLKLGEWLYHFIRSSQLMGDENQLHRDKYITALSYFDQKYK